MYRNVDAMLFIYVESRTLFSGSADKQPTAAGSREQQIHGSQQGSRTGSGFADVSNRNPSSVLVGTEAYRPAYT